MLQRPRTRRRQIPVLLLVLLPAVASAAPPLVQVLDRPDTERRANTLYPGNRPPLLPSSFINLPFGSIEPDGWLRRQLELQADGFVGHLTEISAFCRPEGNAWLNAEGLGGSSWEEVPYWFRGYCATGYVLDDKDLVAKAQPWIEACFASQRDSGYFGPQANLNAPDGVPDLMPNMNMIFALRSYYEYSGDQRVIDLMTRYYKWELEIPDQRFFSGGWQVPRNGDDMDSVYWLYNRTGDAFLLELAAKLQRTGKRWLDTDTGGHNVDFSQGFRKPAQFHQQNKNPEFLAASEKNWDSIMGIYGQVPGGTFGGDEFARPGYTGPRQAIETCGAVEMIISEAILLRITGAPKWADRFEDIAYNTLPATMTADHKALRYLTSPNQVNSDARSKAPELADGGPMQVMNPHDHRCCQHNCGAGWPYFAQAIWQATPGNGLAAVSYAPCRIEARVGDGTKVTITERTQYPFDGKVSFTLEPATPTRFPLYLRIPGWCANPAAELNDRPLEFAGRPGSYLLVDRTWKEGDQLVIKLPMEVSVRTWHKNHDSVSIDCGPLTFSLAIGETYKPHKPERFKAPWPAWEILPATAWNYGLDFDPAAPAKSFKVVRKPWPADEKVFTHEGTPLELRAPARKIPNWQEDHLGLVDKLQPSPVKSAEPLETVTMIPMGAARLRLTALPRIGAGDGAHQWTLPPEPLVSYCRGANDDPYGAMFDGRVPRDPGDRSPPRFTTYSFGGAEHGKLHWVRREFDKPTTVSSCAVWWYEESARKGDVRLPKWWKVLYKHDGEWKEVEGASSYGIEPDTFNTVTFKPVTTTELRLDVQTGDDPRRWAMGIYEWKIK